jgi:hypothetical protein
VGAEVAVDAGAREADEHPEVDGRPARACGGSAVRAGRGGAAREIVGVRDS